MKISKIILPLLFAFAILSFSFKSNQNSNKIEVLLEKIDTEKLCKTWYIVSGIVKAEAEEEELPEDMINGKFIFHKNFKVSMVEPGTNESEEGTWKDKNGKLYINIDNDPMSFTIETLTDNSLVISLDKDGIYASMTMSTSKKED